MSRIFTEACSKTIPFCWRSFATWVSSTSFLRWLTSFLCQRRQRVKLVSVQSVCATINVGVPQGTVLGPVGFLLHINDLHTTSNSTKYVDDTTFWESCSTDYSDSQLRMAADQAYEWFEKDLMKITPDKTKTTETTFTGTHCDTLSPVCMREEPLQSVTTFKLLGIILSSDLTWGVHVDYLHRKCSRRLYLLIMLKRTGVPIRDILRTCLTMIRSVSEYACQVWAHVTVWGSH